MRKLYNKFFIFSSILLSSFLVAKDELVICSIFRNEAPWLKEWIDYHLHNGVCRFYLYNHLSDDNYREVLSPYIRTGQVILIEWNYPEWPKAQLDAMRDAIRRVRGKAKWAAMIDVDEFIVCDRKKITQFLSRYSSSAGVVIHWQIFGTSGIDDLKGDSLLKNMVFKAPIWYDNPEWNSNRFVKSIIRPDRINEKSSDPNCGNHVFEPISGYYLVNEFNMYIIPECKRSGVTINRAQINHYFFRDEKFFYQSKLDRRESSGYKYSPELVEQMLKDCNQEVDFRIQKRIPK